ncbi:MAG: L,D-transpeptidase [Rhodoblastus sp.]|nr:L,D-transpeptidase [Rhodoblastus sp.]
MKRFVFAVMALFGATLFFTAAAQAKVQIHIDLSSQRMTVNSSSGSYVWPVSTARSGYVTPRGSYRPTSLQRMHYSRKYHMSPMPHSIFFRGGYAIHGTYATSQLGRPASHGCVRLAPGNAAALFAMVQREGASISITGSAPGRVYASSKKKYGKHYARAGHKKYKHYASSRHHKRWKHYAGRGRAQAPMAYAPSRGRVYRGTVRSFQLDPAGRY